MSGIYLIPLSSCKRDIYLYILRYLGIGSWGWHKKCAGDKFYNCSDLPKSGPAANQFLSSSKWRIPLVQNPLNPLKVLEPLNLKVCPSGVRV